MKFEIQTDRLVLKILGPEAAHMVLSFYQRNRDIFEKYEPVIGDDFYTLSHQKKILDFEHKNILKLVMVRYNPSIHMVEKLGFKYEGILHDKIIINGERLDHCMYAYLADN